MPPVMRYPKYLRHFGRSGGGRAQGLKVFIAKIPESSAVFFYEHPFAALYPCLAYIEKIFSMRQTI